MSRDYFVTATVTYTARIRADSKDEAEEIAFASNGEHPLDLTDVSIDVVDPRSREGERLAAPGAFP